MVPVVLEDRTPNEPLVEDTAGPNSSTVPDAASEFFVTAATTVTLSLPLPSTVATLAQQLSVPSPSA